MLTIVIPDISSMGIIPNRSSFTLLYGENGVKDCIFMLCNNPFMYMISDNLSM